MRRRVWVLATVAVLLGIIAFVSTPDGEGMARIDFALPPLDEISKIRIERDETTLTLLREDDKWSIMPGKHSIDEQARRDLQTVMGDGVAMDQSLSPEEVDPASLGLSETAPKITLETKGGDQILFGVGKLVNGRHTFIAPRGETAVYRARANLARVFERPLNLWRERQLFELPFDAVAAVERRQGQQTVWRAERADARSPWRLVHPAGLDAGQREVDAVANTLVTLRADRFLGEDTQFQNAYSVRGETFDGVTFGVSLEPTKSRTIRGRTVPGGAIAELPRSRVLFLDVQVSDLRNRRLFDFDVDDVLEVVVPRTPKLHLKRLDDAQWVLVTTSGNVSIDGDRAAEYLKWLTTLRTAGFPAQSPEDAFENRADGVVIRLRENRQTTLVLGSEYRNGARFARPSDRPGEVYILSPSALQRLATPASFFTDAP